MFVIAAGTTILAGWGLIGGVVPPTSISSSSASSTATTAEVSTSTTTQYSTSTSSASVSTASAESTTTATITATTTVTSTSVATTATSTTTTVVVTTTQTAPSGAVSTTTVTGTSVVSTGSFVPIPGESLLREAQSVSILLAPVAWVVLGGAWMWRGRVRSRYTEMGFGSDVFELFMKMKGGATRIKVLNTLSTPKDRLQLAEELGVDWKTVDRHVQILNKYGFVKEQASFGTVRLYEVTPTGKMLLNLFHDLEGSDGPVGKEPTPSGSGDGKDVA